MIKTMSAITLRRGEEILFGTLVRMRKSQLGIFCDGSFEKGDFLEWQLELTGWDQVVSGIGEVHKAELRAPDINRYLVQILEMRRSDKELLEAWYDELADLDGEEEPALLDGVGSCAPPPRSVPQPGTDQLRGRPAGDERQEGWSALPSLIVSQTADDGGSRREALRAVLRAAFREPLPAEGSHAPVGEGGVAVRIHGWKSPPLVELRYTDDLAWRADWQAWLRQGLAFARGGGGVLEVDETVSLRLQLPGRVDVTCPARVVLVHASGVGMALDLDPHQMELLVSISEEAPDSGASASDQSSPVAGLVGSRGRTFWARLFGLDIASDPVEEAIADLVDPLAPLDLGPPRNRQRLDAILGQADRNYLVLCDEVEDLLAVVGWRWPELEDRTQSSPKPLARAAAYIVLAHVVRREAIANLRQISAEAGQAPAVAEVFCAEGHPCGICRPHLGDPAIPAALARYGLPPFHFGCRCRVRRAIAG